MNNKEFIAELSARLGYTIKDTSDLLATSLTVITRHLQEEEGVVIPGFGTFEVKKKMERISVHPLTKQQMLVPPKLVVMFKPSISLKDKFKEENFYE